MSIDLHLYFAFAGQFAGVEETFDKMERRKLFWLLNYLGGVEALEVSEEQYNNPPNIDTWCRVGGILGWDKNNCTDFLNVRQLHIEGITKDFKPVTFEEQRAGNHFQGYGIVGKKTVNETKERDGKLLHLALMQTMGGARQVLLTPELYQVLPQPGELIKVAGHVLTQITSFESFGRRRKEAKIQSIFESIQHVPQQVQKQTA